MKILIADSFPQSHHDQLVALGHDVTANPDLGGDELGAALPGFEILIVRSTKVTSENLDSGTELRMVIRAGAGTNTIDKAHAASRGIAVCNVPGANAVAVAELAMGLILSIDRHIPSGVADLRNNQWNKARYSKATGLFGQNIGILGMGAIGMALAERARAFGMGVYSLDKPGRSATATERLASLGVNLVGSMEELLPLCDIVSLHMPATPETTKMVNSDFLARMKDGSILINTSRGELVDEDALLKAMNNRGIRAGLDVYDNEPSSSTGEFHSPLATHENVCGSHHIGASTSQAQIAVADGVIDVIDSLLNGDPINRVN